MEKFLCYFKLSKGSIIIGWFKLGVSGILVILSVVAMIFGTVLLDLFKNALSDEKKEYNSISEWKVP
jgi:hypothetical protein